ncbi:MAG TPA: hypothetical protein VFA21_05825 [Pyrinomonadaceae bacterium]|nr:hypothetical protein [Pyrinomonadaceae bacterium]
MNKTKALKAAAPLLSLAVSLACLVTPARARQREHLTDEEIELVRDNQELDKRTAVFIKAAERRLLAVTDPDAAAKQSAKEKAEWGEVKGTRAQLFYDISKILDEAVTNVDDSATHNPNSPLLRKSLYMLSEAASRILPQLDKLRASAQSEAEADNLDRAIETAKEITAAAGEHGVTAEDLKTKDGKNANVADAPKDSKDSKDSKKKH